MERLGDKARRSGDARRRCAARPGHRRRGDVRRDRARPRRDRVPRAAEGDRGRRRQGDAARGGARRARGRLRRGGVRGGRRVRRRLALPREGGRPARHVEIQVLCDARRRRAHARRARVLDPAAAPEARSRSRRRPRSTPETREEMEAAVERACRAVGYRNAGTFEFLLGPEGEPYFIEVNCRLQVEHPVWSSSPASTSCASSCASPRARHCAATGRAPRSGHAIEIRVNAEDPSRGFAARPGDGDALPAAARRRACGSTRRSRTGARSRRTTTR